ncbi:hypothetical protein ACFUJU_23490 [Streptomyces sp. NPDC057235]|uniref:hypothetical protein n=1 Tax=Streptomyces sp. NPDC057235 TaxID=3346058 RepID=UPI00363D6155
MRDDADAATRGPARTDLFVLAPKAEVDADPERVRRRSHPEPGHRAVIARGMSPPWPPDRVFRRVPLRWTAAFHQNYAAPRPWR